MAYTFKLGPCSAEERTRLVHAVSDRDERIAALEDALRRYEWATRWVEDIGERSIGDVTNYRLSGMHINNMKDARAAPISPEQS